ncbi:transposase [Streptomyces sp. NPDC005989]|uniref:transposase n=1 Tax=Streptomyces sp. NPDC005989 TaxID=3156727 RepID=UPI00340587C2
MNGRKRHIVVDTLGLLLTVMVTAASVTDRDAGQTLLARLSERHWRVTRVWADGGYTGRLVDFARGVLRVALTVVNAATTPAASPCCRRGGWWSARSRG